MAVREACCRFMERQMDEMNCVGIHCFAEAHSCKMLEKRSMDYILEHFSSVYQQVRDASWRLNDAADIHTPVTPPPHCRRSSCRCVLTN